MFCEFFVITGIPELPEDKDDIEPAPVIGFLSEYQLAISLYRDKCLQTKVTVLL